MTSGFPKQAECSWNQFTWDRGQWNFMCRGKSVDLRRNAKSEGSSLGPYRRWGTKAWGANRIRYPSSPYCKWWVFALGLHRSGAQLTHETLCLGSTVTRPKLKGIDRGVHNWWSMWFNLIQRAKTYQPLTYEQQNLSLTGWYTTFIQVMHGCCQLMSWDVWSSPITRNPRFELLRHVPKEKWQPKWAGEASDVPAPLLDLSANT